MKSTQQRQPLRREPVRDLAFNERGKSARPMIGAAVRVDAVRCEANRSDGFFTVARGERMDRALKNFAALHRDDDREHQGAAS